MKRMSVVVLLTVLPGALVEAVGTTKLLSGPTVLKGQLKEDMPDMGRPGSFCQIHALDLPAKKPVVLHLVSREFDAYLRIEDEQGKILAEDDDDGGGLNARLVFTPPRAARYKIIVTSFAPGETGAYLLTIHGAVKTWEGKLSKDDPVDSSSKKHFRVHEFQLNANETYQIDLQSDQFDAYLRLEDGNKKVLMEDDDGGTLFNAQLTFTPKETATYRIIVTTFPPDTVGSYRLSISPPPPERKENPPTK